MKIKLRVGTTAPHAKHIEEKCDCADQLTLDYPHKSPERVDRASYNRVMQVLEIWGEVPSKKNSYRSNGKGGLYKPTTITDFEQMIAKEVLVQKIREVTGNFSITIVIKTHNDRHDIDNAATTIIDALQSAGVYGDDKDMWWMHVARLHVYDAKDAGAKITISNYVKP